MSKPLIPDADEDFDVFVNQFSTETNADPAAFGLDPQEAAAIKTAVATWNKDFQQHKDSQAQARADAKQKDKTRASTEKVVRGAARVINGNPAVDNAVRAKAGMPPHDEVRSPVGAPTSRPFGRTEYTGPRTLTLHFGDLDTPTSRAKPEGVHGCQIHFAVGDQPPADEKGYTFLALDTRTPYVHTHAAADVGKNAHYLLRWANAKGETGPWSDVITAKIPA